VPDPEAAEIAEVAPVVSYGWGVVPVTVTTGSTTWTTSLFPKDGGYVVPIKDLARRGEGLEVGGIVALRLTIDLSASGPTSRRR
jgi:hypothetical protein